MMQQSCRKGKNKLTIGKFRICVNLKEKASYSCLARMLFVVKRLFKFRQYSCHQYEMKLVKLNFAYSTHLSMGAWVLFEDFRFFPQLHSLAGFWRQNNLLNHFAPVAS